MNNLIAHPERRSLHSSGQNFDGSKLDAAKFAPFWNEIVKNLREEDYLTNLGLTFAIVSGLEVEDGRMLELFQPGLCRIGCEVCRDAEW
ncbi:hypothetical protein Taro_023858, partial [Colocasia esculenta]|nr:hypothetical protein [Colocasia esculenta]